MQKSFAFLVSVLILSLFSTTTVSALEIVVSEDGSVQMYKDGVLGDTTEEGEPKYKPAPTGGISPQQGRMLRVRNTGDQESVEIIDQDPNKRQEVTKMEAERLRLQMSGKPLPEDASSSTEKREILKEIKGAKAQQSLEERNARINEKIELRRATVASKSALELRSRDVRATIPVNKEIIIDPETNEVAMVLPNGKIKALNHLPDQAQARIAAMVENPEELELTTLEDGRVVYTTTVRQVFRMLGVFKREITTEVTLDDATGEVTEEKVADNPIDGVLNAISF